VQSPAVATTAHVAPRQHTSVLDAAHALAKSHGPVRVSAVHVPPAFVQLASRLSNKHEPFAKQHRPLGRQGATLVLEHTSASAFSVHTPPSAAHDACVRYEHEVPTQHEPPAGHAPAWHTAPAPSHVAGCGVRIAFAQSASDTTEHPAVALQHAPEGPDAHGLTLAHAVPTPRNTPPPFTHASAATTAQAPKFAGQHAPVTLVDRLSEPVEVAVFPVAPTCR